LSATTTVPRRTKRFVNISVLWFLNRPLEVNPR